MPEREADAVAKRVLSAGAAPPESDRVSHMVQRAIDPVAESAPAGGAGEIPSPSQPLNAEIGAGPISSDIDRVPVHEGPGYEARQKDEPTTPIGLGGGPLPGDLREYLRSSASTGRQLDGAMRSDLEGSFGRSLGGVRLISDEGAARAAAMLQARAFTLGNSIWFGGGEYRPETHEGRHLIAHEVAHSLQDASPASQVFADLLVGTSDDPAEREADRAADAAVRGERVSLSPAGAGAVRLQRIACSASPASRPDQRIVRCPNGDFLVTLTTTTEPSGPSTQTWTNAGWNNSEMWLELGLCRGGTSMTVRPLVDLPAAIGRVLGNVLSGSGALSGVTLTPGLQIQVIQSGSFTLTLRPDVTVGQGGVTGVGGSVTVQTGDFTAGVQGTYDPQTGSGGLTFTFSDGARQPTVDCPRQSRQRLVFTCRQITHIAPTPEVPERTTTDVEQRYLFFNYKQDTVAPDFQRPRTRPGTTPSVDLRERIQAPTDIDQLRQQGYHITSIEGFTSPEGPRGPGPNFEGNIELGQRRADAALRWVQTQCPACNTTGVAVRGRAELPPAQGATEPEPTGRPMERGAVEEFLTTDPLRPTDVTTEAEFRSLPERRRRDQVFELQRRAVIRFEHTSVVQPHVAAVPGRDETGEPVGCATEVVEEARHSFGITILNTPSLTR